MLDAAREWPPIPSPKPAGKFVWSQSARQFDQSEWIAARLIEDPATHVRVNQSRHGEFQLAVGRLAHEDCAAAVVYIDDDLAVALEDGGVGATELARRRTTGCSLGPLDWPRVDPPRRRASGSARVRLRLSRT